MDKTLKKISDSLMENVLFEIKGTLSKKQISNTINDIGKSLGGTNKKEVSKQAVYKMLQNAFKKMSTQFWKDNPNTPKASVVAFLAKMYQTTDDEILSLMGKQLRIAIINDMFRELKELNKPITKNEKEKMEQALNGNKTLLAKLNQIPVK